MGRKYWAGEAMGSKPGALHQQLCIPQDAKIPVTLMRTILAAETGDTIRNPTKVGKPRYRVTTLMQRRVNPALTARRFRHGRRRRGRIVR